MINIILDPILIFGLLDFLNGVKGAAVATVIGQISAFLLYIAVYLRKIRGLRFIPNICIWTGSLIRQILYSVGIPSSLMMTMPSVLVGRIKWYPGQTFSDTYVAVLGNLFQTSDIYLYAGEWN